MFNNPSSPVVNVGKHRRDAAVDKALIVSGQVGGYSPLIDVVPVLDTGAYAIGDIFFLATLIPGAMRDVNLTGFLQTLIAIDKSDGAGLTFDLHFFDAPVAMGTINQPPSISDADSGHSLGYVSFPSSAWKDLGGAKIAEVNQLAMNMRPAADTTSIYVAGIIGTANTFALGDLVLKFGFEVN